MGEFMQRTKCEINHKIEHIQKIQSSGLVHICTLRFDSSPGWLLDLPDTGDLRHGCLHFKQRKIAGAI